MWVLHPSDSCLPERPTNALVLQEGQGNLPQCGHSECQKTLLYALGGARHHLVKEHHEANQPVFITLLLKPGFTLKAAHCFHPEL